LSLSPALRLLDAPDAGLTAPGLIRQVVSADRWGCRRIWSADGSAEQMPDQLGDGQPQHAADHNAGDGDGPRFAAQMGVDPTSDAERDQHDPDTHDNTPRGWREHDRQRAAPRRG
jgi:hypothetical protein